MVGSVTATRSSSLFVDQNGDGLANLGDALLTHILVMNTTASPIANGMLDGPANGTTVVSGSVLATHDGAYSLTGNTPIAENAGTGLLANDFNIGGGAVSTGGLVLNTSSQTTGPAPDAASFSGGPLVQSSLLQSADGVAATSGGVSTNSFGVSPPSSGPDLVPDPTGADFTVTIGNSGLSLTPANLAAAGLNTADVHLDKLQNGLAEIYVESQFQVAALSGAARTSGLDAFHSVNTAAEIYNGMVAIDAVATNGDGAALLSQLESLGLQSGASYGAMAGGFIPLDALGSLSNAGLLAFARPVYVVTESAGAGSVISQDVQALHADTVQAGGVTGAGITIGILSDSFNTSTSTDKYANDVASGDLPAGINIIKDFAGGTDEGRGMAQVAYDIAPGANFAFYTGDVSMADFANGIVTLSTSGAKIIVDDLRYFAEPMFQDGILAKADETAFANGAMVFSSAGNYADLAYDSVFHDSGQTITTGGVTYEMHDFDPGAGVDTMQAIRFVGQTFFILQADQPFFSLGGAGATSDIALFFFNHTTHALISVVDSTHVGGDPIEIGGLTSGNGGASVSAVDIGIGVRQGTPLPNEIKYAMIGGNSVVDEFATNSATMYGHANAKDVVAVGAADWYNTPAFGQTAPLGEYFTSKGGQNILFDNNGVRLTTPEVRSGVAFTAPDGGNTTFFGFDVAGDADALPNFYGTSAAAPNAAAVAALMMQANPGATRGQILTALKGSAIDIGNNADNIGSHNPAVVTGPANDAWTGTGLIQANQAVTNVVAGVTATRSSSLSTDVNGDGHANPGDTILTHIIIPNATASSLTNVTVDDPANGTTIVAGSVLVTHDDAYALTGNTPITEAVGSGLLANDFNIGGGTVTLTAINGTALSGGAGTFVIHDGSVPATVAGSLAVNSDGSFTFTPAAGYDGTATFTYNATDAAGTVNTSTVNLVVSGLVWYVTQGAAAGGDGTFSHPFNNLAPLNGTGNNGATTGDVDNANDTIVVHGSVAGPITLENGQILYGDGSSFIVNGHTITSGSATHSTITAASGATVTLGSGNTIDGVDLAGTGTAAGMTGTNFGTLNVAHSSISTATGQILSLTNGTIDNSTGGVTFGTLNASGVVTGSAIVLSNVDNTGTGAHLGTFTAGGVSVAGATVDGVHIDGGSSATFAFNNTTSVGNITGDGIHIDGNSTAGDGAVTFNSVTVNGQTANTGTGNGVSIVNDTGAVTISGGTIGATNDPTGEDVHISGGGADVTIAAALTKTTAGDVVDISSHTGGTIALSGNISATGAVANGINVSSDTGGTVNFSGQSISLATGAATGVNVASNTGGTVNFTGQSIAITTNAGNGVNLSSNTGATINFNPTSGGTGLDIATTTGTGFNASGGGTVTIQGSGNSIHSVGAAGVGSGIQLANVTIGSAGITLHDVASSNGSVGISLINTGTGIFHVTGDTSTVVGGDSTGGTITGATGADGNSAGHNAAGTGAGDGVYLSNANNVTLDRMHLSNEQNFGVNVEGGSNFVMSYTKIDGANGTSATVDEGSVRILNLTGNNLLESNDISGGVEDNIRIDSDTGNLTGLTINNNTIHDNNTTTGNQGILVDVIGGITTHYFFTNNTFFHNRADSIFVGASGGAASSSALVDATITGNHFNGERATDLGGGVQVQTANFDGHLQFDISNNTFQPTAGNVSPPAGSDILVDAGAASSAGVTSTLVEGRINNNVIGTAGAASSGTQPAVIAVFLQMHNEGTFTTAVTNNNIREYGAAGIELEVGGAGLTTGTVNATLTGNTIAQPSGGAGAVNNGILTDLGTNAGNAETINLDISGNSLAGSGTNGGIGQEDMRLHSRFSTTVNLKGYSGDTSSADGPAVVAYLQSQNPTGSPTASASNTNGVHNIASITPPTLPSAQPVLPAPLQVTPPSDTVVGDKPVNDPTVTTGPDSSTGPGASTGTDGGVLTQDALTMMVAAAIDRWAAAGATPQEIAQMKSVTVSIASIAGLDVGDATPGHIAISSNGAGYGWFIDPTPAGNSEFTGTGTDLVADPNGPAAGKIDLLTVLMHELGHEVGLVDDYKPADSADLMYGFINPGERRLPSGADAAAATGTPVDHESFSISAVAVGLIPAGQSAEVGFRATVNTLSPGLVPTFSNQSTVHFDPSQTVLSNTEIYSSSAGATISLASLSLGDRVYADTNSNGTYNAGEGVSGVALTLYTLGTIANPGTSGVDVNADGINDTVVTTTTTGTDGLYSFTGLAPGDYVVSVDASNFASGHALNGKTVIGTAANPNSSHTDNDNNAVAGPGGTVVSNPDNLAFDQEGPGFNGTAGNNTDSTLDLGFVSNSPPTANNDSPTVNEDSGANDLTATLLSNDTDPDNDTLTITNNTAASHGTVQLTSGTLTYTPVANYNGSDSFTYTISDGHGHTSTATANVTVSAVNDPVTASAPATLTLNEDASAAVSGLSISDVDATLAPSGVYQFTLSDSHGVLTLTTTTGLTLDAGANASGTMTYHGTLANINSALATAHYAGNANYNGTDSIVLAVTDGFNSIVATGSGAATSDTKSVAVTVNSVNDAPSGTDNTVTFLEDGQHNFTVADFGFTDPDLNSFANVIVTTAPTHGGIVDLAGGGFRIIHSGDSIPVADIAAGQVVYTTAQNGNGTPFDSFTFRVQDDGGTANGGVDTDPSPNTFTFNVTPVNDAPSFTKGPDITVDGNSGADTVTNWATAISAGPADESGQAVHFNVTNNNNPGLFSVAPAIASDGTLTFTPAAGMTGTATITIDAQDDGGTANGGVDTSATQTFTISVLPPDNPPSISTSPPVNEAELTPVTLNGAFTVSDGDLDALNGGSGDYAGASFTVNRTGGANAEDGFSLNTTGASFTVSGSNLQSGGQTFATFTASGGVLEIDFTSSQTAATTALVDDVLRHVQYTNGSVSPPASVDLTYAFNDGAPGHGQGNPVGGDNIDAHQMTVNIIASNGPVIDLDSTAGGANSVISFTEGDPATHLTISGTVADPSAPNFAGGTLTVQFTSGATVDDQLLVIGLSPDDGGQLFNSSAELIGQVSGGTSSSDPLVITFTANATAQDVQDVLNKIGYADFSNNPGSADRVVSFTLTDGHSGTSNVATATVHVTPVDTPPTVNDDQFTTDESTPVTINVVANDSDPDGPQPQVTAINGVAISTGQTVALASGAKLTLNANGTLTYDPNHKFDTLTSTAGGETGASNTSADDHFTYSVQGGTSANVIMTVTGVANAADHLAGSAGDDTITGTANGDFFDLSQGGNDKATGLGGNDVFYFGGALTSADQADGGVGTDQIALQGDYAALTLGTGVVNVESLVLLPGSDIRFGDPGTNFYSYNITTVDQNVAAGVQMTVDANRLRPGENFTFDGSAETDGSFFIYGGMGIDHLTGGAKNDVFLFGTDPGGNLRWGSSDFVDGGPGGIDQLALRGNYSGANAITFGAGQIHNIQSLALMSAFDTRFGALGDHYSYDITMNDGNLASGQRMTVDASLLRATETLTFNGAAEVDGSFRVFGGAGDDHIIGSQNGDTLVGALGADTLTGGAGNDTFLYRSVAESTPTGHDTITDLTLGDLIDLSAIDADTTQAGQQHFTFVNGGVFTNHAGELIAVNNGSDNWTISADTNGDGVADLQILVHTPDHHPITASDFHL